MPGSRASTSKGGPSNGAGEGRFVAQLSRRVKACDECRRHKIRCNLPASGSPPCDRCVKNGIDCQLTKSLQSILDERQSDKAWRSSVENRLEAIVKAMEEGGSAQALHDLRDVMNEEKSRKPLETEEDRAGASTKRRRVKTSRSNTPGEESLGLGLLADAASVENTPMRKKHWEDEELANPAHAPGEHLRQLAQTNGFNSIAPTSDVTKRKKQPDIIDQGLITYGQACTLLDIYTQHLDKHTWKMVSRNHIFSSTERMLDDVRHSSLLLVAICTVASLHCGSELDKNGVTIKRSSVHQASKLHTRLYNEFVRVSAQQSFAKHQSTDDIRALLIGSLWLRELSWILTASAVRIVTERGMQDSFQRCANLSAGKMYIASRGDEDRLEIQCAQCPPTESSLTPSELYECYKEAILYYQVYVADHQAAIPFSRPPMTRQHAAVRNARAWLAGSYCGHPDDVNLIAEVELWVIAHDIVDDFGVDVHEPLTDQQVLQFVPRYVALIERLKKRWIWYPVGDRLDQTQMLLLFLYAHAFRAPVGASALMTLNYSTASTPAHPPLDDLADRESVVMTVLPGLASDKGDALQARIEMGDSAIALAAMICMNCRMSDLYGEPIYPLVMLMFACLFLNKMARTYAEDVEDKRPWYALLGESGASLRRVGDQVLLNKGEKMQIIDRLQTVSERLSEKLVSKCAALHFCSSVTANLAAIAADLKRQCESQSNQANATEASGDDALQSLHQGIAPFEIDLQALDLLSNTRFISGVNEDASLWFNQDWLASQ